MSVGKFVLENGNVVFPSYMTKDDKQKLRDVILKSDDPKTYMRCGCRNDMQLYYGISKDLRFVPVHQMYEHGSSCSRYTGVREAGYVIDDNGAINSFLSFDPFTMPKIRKMTIVSELEAVADSVEEPDVDEGEEEEKEKKKREKKDTTLSLDRFIKQLNFDTYMSRVAAGKSAILPSRYFNNSVKGRSKQVAFSFKKSGKADKNIGELTLKEDDCQFMYAVLDDLYVNDSGFWNVSLNYPAFKKPGEKTVPPDKTYDYFIPTPIIIDELKRLMDKYGVDICDPDFPLDKDAGIVAAGFLYNRLSRKQSKYRVIGRIHLFFISKHGIYCEDLDEVKLYDCLLSYADKNKISLFLPSEGEKWFVHLVKDGKSIYVFKKQVPSEYKDLGEKAVSFRIVEEMMEAAIVDKVDSIVLIELIKSIFETGS